MGGMGADGESGGEMPWAQPVIFCAHGGGPLPLIGQQPAYLAHFKRLPQELPGPPRSILVISAHWAEETPTVSTDERNSLLFDYYGFPQETYEFKWQPRGSPAVAKRVCELLAGAGVDCKTKQNRGLDHGVFVPLMAGFPDAEVPVVQLSLVKGHDPALHTRIGEALRPLRKEGVMILGSGMSFHNMQVFMSAMGGGGRDSDVAERSAAFDQHLTHVLTNPQHCAAPARAGSGCARQDLLIEWRRFPHAAFCHPPGGEEHLAPLFVCAGSDSGTKIFSNTDVGIAVSSFKFG